VQEHHRDIAGASVAVAHERIEHFYGGHDADPSS
jgi:hypothetical protein